jgi:drug/metabolite transporter (DMT)-like permease
MPAQRHPIRGFFYIALATLQWGIAASLGRAVFTGKLRIGGEVVNAINPLLIAQGRVTYACLVLMTILIARRGVRALLLPRRDLITMLLIGTLGMAASNYFYYLAIQRTNVATAIIVQYTAPVWVLLYMVGRGLQKPTLQRIGAVGFGIVGIALAIDLIHGNALRLDALGVGAALLAAFSFSYYNIAVHDVLTRHDRWKILLWAVLIATVFWMAVNPPWKIAAAGYSRSQFEFLALFSLISMLGPFSCYFAGLQHLEPTRAVVTSCLEPVFSILIAAIFLGERVNGTQVIGIVLVLGAIILAQLPDRADPAAMLVEPIE